MHWRSCITTIFIEFTISRSYLIVVDTNPVSEEGSGNMKLGKRKRGHSIEGHEDDENLISFYFLLH
jgi:hypothetical protein